MSNGDRNNNTFYGGVPFEQRQRNPYASGVYITFLGLDMYKDSDPNVPVFGAYGENIDLTRTLANFLILGGAAYATVLMGAALRRGKTTTRKK